MKVYFDNAASTPVHEEVKEKMWRYYTSDYGNPNSVHSFGRTARAAVEKTRKLIASYLNVSSAEIFFTSCGTESNNMVLKNAVNDLGIKRIITSPIEHHCVLHTAQYLEKKNIKLEYVSVDSKGIPDLKDLELKLTQSSEKTLVSLMHCNNEIGSMISLYDVAEICNKHKALFHSDTVQTFGWYPFDLQKTKVHFVSGSAHKFHGPKGIGFVYINAENMIGPYLHGGAQERNMRAGTENVAGIAGMGKALEINISNLDNNQKYIQNLKSYFKERAIKEISEVMINGSEDDSQSNFRILNLSIPLNSKTELIIFNLDIAGIAASGGSACASGSLVGSHVLAGIGADENRVAVRFSFSSYNNTEEVDYVIEQLKRIV